jgi:hypothetical protein
MRKNKKAWEDEREREKQDKKAKNIRRGGKWKTESNTKMRLKRIKIIKINNVYITVFSTHVLSQKVTCF